MEQFIPEFSQLLIVNPPEEGHHFLTLHGIESQGATILKHIVTLKNPIKKTLGLIGATDFSSIQLTPFVHYD